MMVVAKTKRRSLAKIQHYPTPNDIATQLENSKGWPYKTNMEYYLARDRAMVSLLYLLACRISEALRLEKTQFKTLKDRIVVSSLKLSKVRKGHDEYRPEAWLPLKGDRAQLTEYVEEYLRQAEHDRLFIHDRSQAWKITQSLLGIPNHWLRAYGENYLYDAWDHDMIAVGQYISVDPQILPKYIRQSFKKYKAV